MASSFSSRTMQTSSMRRICSASWPSSSDVLVVSMSGKRRRMVSALMPLAWEAEAVTVVVVDILGWILYQTA